MKILVIGACGVSRTHLVEALIKHVETHEVMAHVSEIILAEDVSDMLSKIEGPIIQNILPGISDEDFKRMVSENIVFKKRLEVPESIESIERFLEFLDTESKEDAKKKRILRRHGNKFFSKKHNQSYRKPGYHRKTFGHGRK